MLARVASLANVSRGMAPIIPASSEYFPQAIELLSHHSPPRKQTAADAASTNVVSLAQIGAASTDALSRFARSPRLLRAPRQPQSFHAPSPPHSPLSSSSPPLFLQPSSQPCNTRTCPSHLHPPAMSIAALRSFPAVYGVKPSPRLQAPRGRPRHARLIRASSSVAVNGEVGLGNRSGKDDQEEDAVVKDKEQGGLEPMYDDGFGGVTVKDYFAAARELSKADGGPPRWFCPVESGRPAVRDAPLLLFLPG